MLSFVMHTLGRARKQREPAVSIPKYQPEQQHRQQQQQQQTNKARNRLQKPPQRHALYPCKGIFDIVLAQTSLTLIPTDDETAAGVEQSREQATQPPHIGYLVEASPELISKLSKDSIRISITEMQVEELKRTRAKTPCFWIGQLESKSHDRTEANDLSVALADQYQSLLPPRTFTPFSDSGVSISPQRPRKTVRKVKGSHSLRDLVIQEVEEHSSSDTETLVGTPSLGSPTSQDFSWKVPAYAEDIKEIKPSVCTVADDGLKEDVGSQMCLDLLTSELETGLFKNHSSDTPHKRSSLQILLMIEAYETVQKQIRQEIKSAHVTGDKIDHVEAVEKSLDNWLDALYKLYEKEGSIKSVLDSSDDDDSSVSTKSVPSPKMHNREDADCCIYSDTEDIYYDFEDKL